MGATKNDKTIQEETLTKKQCATEVINKINKHLNTIKASGISFVLLLFSNQINTPFIVQGIIFFMIMIFLTFNFRNEKALKEELTQKYELE